MAVRITCINKDYGNHEAGTAGYSSRIDMYNWFTQQGGMAYVTDNF